MVYYEYYIDTGLARTYPKKFRSDKEAWNHLALFLNKHYGIRKGGKRNGIVGILYRIEVANLKFVGTDILKPKNKIPVASGYIRLKWR